MKTIRMYGRNLGCNWYFPLGAAAFYCCWFDNIAACPEGLVIAIVLCAAAAARTGSLWRQVFGLDWKLRLLASSGCI